MSSAQKYSWKPASAEDLINCCPVDFPANPRGLSKPGQFLAGLMIRAHELRLHDQGYCEESQAIAEQLFFCLRRLPSEELALLHYIDIALLAMLKSQLETAC